MNLGELEAYRVLGLNPVAIDRLARLGDAVLESEINVTALRTPAEIERGHILDSLSLLDIEALRVTPLSVVDVGAGGGFPSLVLAVVLSGASITALESVGKKCAFISRTAERLGLENLRVLCKRAEVAGRGAQRETFDLAVARAVGPLNIVAELCAPLVRVGGLIVAMKGVMSEAERTAGLAALAILGVDQVEERVVPPVEGAEHRRLIVAYKGCRTPMQYPRTAGLPAKRPLGQRQGRKAEA